MALAPFICESCVTPDMTRQECFCCVSPSPFNPNGAGGGGRGGTRAQSVHEQIESSRANQKHTATSSSLAGILMSSNVGVRVCESVFSSWGLAHFHSRAISSQGLVGKNILDGQMSLCARLYGLNSAPQGDKRGDIMLCKDTPKGRDSLECLISRKFLVHFFLRCQRKDFSFSLSFSHTHTRSLSQCVICI